MEDTHASIEALPSHQKKKQGTRITSPPEKTEAPENNTSPLLRELEEKIKIARLQKELSDLQREAAQTPTVVEEEEEEDEDATPEIDQKREAQKAPQRPSPLSSGQRKNSLCTSVLRAISIVAIAVLFYMLVSQYSLASAPVKARPIAITNYFPSTKCLELSVEDVKLLVGSLEWPHIEYSLREHIHTHSLDSVSAFRIGKQYCFIMLRAADNSTIEMFNPHITAISLKNTVSHSERTVNCPERVMHPVRSVRIAVDYLDSETLQPMRATFNGTQSYAMQAEFAYSQGKSICDNSDSGIETLLSIMNQDLSPTQIHNRISTMPA